MLEKHLKPAVTSTNVVASPQAGMGTALSLWRKRIKSVALNGFYPNPSVVEPFFRSSLELDSLYYFRQKKFAKEVIAAGTMTGFNALIPCFEPEVHFTAMNRSILQEAGVNVLVPETTRVKKTLKQNLPRLGLKTPKTSIARTVDAAVTAAEKFGYPVVCKGLVKTSYVVRDENELRLRATELCRNGFFKNGALIQERIKGKSLCVMTLSDYDRTCVSAVCIRKISADSAGATICGETIINKELAALAIAAVERLGWIGPAEFEFFDTPNGHILFEMNPRYPAWVDVSSEAGQNLPVKQLEIMSGKRVDLDERYRPGVAFIRTMSVAYMPATKLSAPKIRTSLAKR